ncbi:hypothetical protein QTP88_018258 [Uroleucon formosanum]
MYVTAGTAFILYTKRFSNRILYMSKACIQLDNVIGGSHEVCVCTVFFQKVYGHVSQKIK